MHNRIKVSLFLVFFSSSFFVCAQQAFDPKIQDEVSLIVKRDVPDNAPGVAFGVMREGQIIYTQYEGLANLEKQQLITGESRFNIASNGKQFTALAILLLADQLKLSLEDDVRFYFPNLYKNVSDSIRIKHLLTHTSGIRDFYDLLSLQGITWWKHTWENEDVLTLLSKQNDLNFRPGEDYLYSNSNYVLLAEIVSKVSGQSFPEYMATLFDKLGMKNTSFESDFNSIDEPIARPYFNFDTWSSYDWKWNVVGDGNLFTSMNDLLRFEMILYQKTSNILSDSIINAFQNRIMDKIDYGYGVEISNFREYPVLYHHGSTGAWKSTFMRIPAKKLTLVTLSNSGKTIVADQNEKIAELLLESKGKMNDENVIKPKAESSFVAGEEIVGIYKSDNGMVFQFEKRPVGIYLIRSGRNDVLLEREAANIFHQAYDPSFKQEFKMDSCGQMKVTVYHPSHLPYSLSKRDTDFAGLDFADYDGKYINTELDVDIELLYTKDKKYKVKISGQEYTGLLLDKREMIVGNYVFLFEQADGFLLDGDRIKRVEFVRKEE